MIIFIIIDDERHITLDVDPKDSIQSVKNKISELKKIPFKQIQISFEGTDLENDKLLENYSIKNDSALRLNVLPKQIHVIIRTMDGNTITKLFNQNTKINELMIDITHDAPEGPHFLFVYDNKELIENCTLKDYSIQDGSTIFMFQKLIGGI